MPYDGTLAAPALRRAQLAEALRLPMPAGHRWSFATYFEEDSDENENVCGTVGCAIGVAHILWPEAELVDGDGDCDEEKVEGFFGMTSEQVTTVFHRSESSSYPSYLTEVPAWMVADALEAVSS